MIAVMISMIPFREDDKMMYFKFLTILMIRKITVLKGTKIICSNSALNAIGT